MKICFYAPFKPLGHAHPSGDLVTAAGIFDYLVKGGHQVLTASTLRCRWLYHSGGFVVYLSQLL